MEYINAEKHEDHVVIALKGHIDSANAEMVENEINILREGCEQLPVTIDARELEYISSAGLRILLRLKKSTEIKIENVSGEVYDVLEMTGFTEMMEVHKAFRQLSVENCEVIGQGANGKVYRIDPDTIVKVYYDPDALPEIERERELARTALILGIPTAIPYDVVKVEDCYGSVFELLNAKSFAQLLKEDPSKIDQIAEMSVDLLKKIHGTLVKPDVMPDMKEVALNWAAFMKDYLPEEEAQKLYRLVEEVPQDLHMLHGDYHIKNVMLQNDEALLIDMDTLCTGHPIFEFASAFNAYQGFSLFDHEQIERFLGISYETGAQMWDKLLHLYFSDKTEEEIQQIADKAKLIGCTRIMRRAIRRKALETEEGKASVEQYKNLIIDLVRQIDTLLY